jgi:hypothetical protein
MKIFSLVYVGLYDDGSIATDTRIAVSYEEACKQRKELLEKYGQEVDCPAELHDELGWELEEGDKIVELTHEVPDLKALKALLLQLKKVAARPLLLKAMAEYIEEKEK